MPSPTLPLPSLPTLIVRSDRFSRRSWTSVECIFYYCGLALLEITNLYIAIRSDTHRALGVILCVLGIAFELTWWQLRCASVHRMEVLGDDIVAELYARECPKRYVKTVAPFVMDSDTNSGPAVQKPTLVDVEAEEMVRTVLTRPRDYHTLEAVVQPFLPGVHPDITDERNNNAYKSLH